VDQSARDEANGIVIVELAVKPLRRVGFPNSKLIGMGASAHTLLGCKSLDWTKIKKDHAYSGASVVRHCDFYPLRPNGFPSTSSIRHGLTDWTDPPHSMQRSRAESCARVSPIEMRGSKLIGRSLVMLHRGQWHSM
jgi:hypothetical protein